jgi:hypothetical protein
MRSFVKNLGAVLMDFSPKNWMGFRLSKVEHLLAVISTVALYALSFSFAFSLWGYFVNSETEVNF